MNKFKEIFLMIMFYLFFQDPINLSLFEPTMDFETLMSLDI